MFPLPSPTPTHRPYRTRLLEQREPRLHVPGRHGNTVSQDTLPSSYRLQLLHANFRCRVIQDKATLLQSLYYIPLVVASDVSWALDPSSIPPTSGYAIVPLTLTNVVHTTKTNYAFTAIR